MNSSYRAQHSHKRGKALAGANNTYGKGPNKKPPPLTEEEKKKKEKEELEKQKQREKEEKERQKQLEKEAKEKQKQKEKAEKERLKKEKEEQKRKEKEEKERQRLKEKEEKEKQKKKEKEEKERKKNKGKAVVVEEKPKEESVRLLLTVTMPESAKRCYFYKDDDTTQHCIKMAISNKKYQKFGNLLTELSLRLPGLNHGVRSIFTVDGSKKIEKVEELENNQKYVCSTYRHYMRGVDTDLADKMPVWHVRRPPSGIRDFSKFLKEDGNVPVDIPRPLGDSGTRMAYAYDSSTKMPKRIVLLKNGEPSCRHLLLLNRRTAQTFDQILDDIGDIMKMAARRLHTTKGKPILSLSELFHNQNVVVVCGQEPFRQMNGPEITTPRIQALASRPGGSLPTTAKA